MNLIQRHLGVALALGAILAAPGLAPARAGDQASDIAVAERLSDAFERVADTIRPSVVSVRSVRKIESGPVVHPFANSPLREFFGDDFFERFGMPQQRGREFFQEGQGSGFIISADGFVVTNHHVIRDADEVEVELADDRLFTAEVIGSDPQTDIAILRIEADNLVPARFGDSDLLRVGEWVVAAGNPFGLSSTFTAGIVSATGRSRVGIADYEDFIQTDAAINPGNSGGPLVNLRGEVVGVNTAIYSRTGGSMGIGFAIPINMVEAIKYSLMEEGRVTRGWLGVIIQDLTEPLAESFGYEGTDGVLISDVAEGGPAEKAGFEPGDIIAAFDGEPVGDMDELRLRVAGTRPESGVDVKVFRDGRFRTLEVTIGELETGELAGAEPGAQEELGMGLRTLTPELAARLGRDENTRGVLVERVAPLSAAARAGLQPRDIIIRVGDEPVSNLPEFRRELRRHDLSEGVRLVVLTGDARRFVFLRNAR